MATGPTTTAATPAATPAVDDDAARKQKAQDQKAQEMRAVQKLRERQQQNNAAEHFKDTHFWEYWKRLDKQPNQVDPHVGDLSSAPGEQTLLEPGTYEKRGIRKVKGNHPILAHFQYDEEKKAFTVSIDVRAFTWGGGHGNHVKWEPVSEGDFNKHAEMTGKEQVRFLAGKPNCFSKVNITFDPIKDRDGNLQQHPFLTGRGGNIGSNTLAYAEKQVAAALQEALTQGVGFEVGSNFLQAVFDKRGSNVRAKLDAEIKKVNENAEKHALLNGFTNPGSLQQHQKALQSADSLTGKWDVDFKKDIESAITEQKQKLKDLTAEFTKLNDDLKDLQGKRATAVSKDMADLDKKIADLEKQIKDKKDQHDDVHVPRLADLENEKGDLEKALGAVTNKEQLQQLKDKLEAAKNPDQKLKDAINELNAAIKEIPQADQDKLKDQLDKLNTFEKRLGTDLNSADRGKVESELKSVIGELRTLTNLKDKEQKKFEAAVGKAEKLAKGEKGQMDAEKRIDDRVAKIEKAATALKDAVKQYKDFETDKLVGMTDGKKTIESPQQARQFIDKRFNGMEQQRGDLQKAAEAEMFRVANLGDPQKKAIQAEQQKFDKAIEGLKSPTDKSEVASAQKAFDDEVKKIINDPDKQKNWDKMAKAREQLVEVKVVQKEIEDAKKAAVAAPKIK